ncbi:hypothetical protein E9549_13645 [Blastococcus sp. MG754426]|uniref:hypothetical protein n=1 Tax=unclassified Blastococcus TaxID=2619396 RepID=UPI001EEF78BE|nr:MULTISPECIES: hypothetical protein [unclassified Blastococcus]MCF6508443.1 hypothetical protein [Blastococcus sp. MG754426]MCF6513444.1 hypothetical protein [Blastococcus sp. MG754427]
MSATTPFRTGSAESYGRHAAPPSAYGPADVHRLPPVSLSRLQVAEEAGDDAEDAAPARAEGETPESSSGFWARLRLLPKAA